MISDSRDDRAQQTIAATPAPAKGSQLPERSGASQKNRKHQGEITPVNAASSRPSLKQRLRRLPRRCSLGMSIWLFVVWMLLIRDLSAVSIGGGLLIAVGLQLFFPMPHVNPVKRFRPLQVAWLALRFGWDLLASALQVAYVVLRNKPARPQMVEVEMVTRSEFYLTMASAMTCLVPGSLVVRARINPSRVTLHVLDRDLSKGARGVEKSLHALEMRIVKALGSKAEIQEAQERLQRYEQLVAAGKIPYSAQSRYAFDEDAQPRPDSERQ